MRRPRFDGVSVLTIYIVLLFVVPSNRTLGPLGGAGSPAMLFGILAGIWWCWYQLSRTDATIDTGRRPVRAVFFGLLAIALVSYIFAMLSPRDGTEINAADLGLLRLVSFASLFLLVNDGIRGAQRFRILLRRLVVAGALFASLGLIQFVTKQSFVDAISIPGFSTTQDFSSVQDRSGFARAAATATNPLEYAFVLSMILPIALSLALDDTSRSRLRRWTPAALIIAALALSGSRSGLVGMLIGIVVLFPTWSSKIRLRALGVAIVGATAVYVLVPGMIGTLRGLFLNISQDPSAVSRTSSYDLAAAFVERNPFFGRGFGTFLPQYRIVDNQYVLAAIELGLIGLIALVALLVTAIAVVLWTRRRQFDPLNRHIAQALAASVAAGATLTAFSDVFSFRQSSGVMFLVLGLCGAYSRLFARRRRQTSEDFVFAAPLFDATARTSDRTMR